MTATEVNPPSVRLVPPKEILVVPIVTDEFVKYELSIVDPCQTPVVIVPTVVRLVLPAKGEAPKVL